MVTALGLFALLVAAEPNNPPLQGYAPASLSEFTRRILAEHPDALSRREGRDTFDVHPVQKITVRAWYSGDARPITGFRRRALDAWCAQHFPHGAAGVSFQREVLVTDGVIRLWVPLQGQLWGFWQEEVVRGHIVELNLAFIGAANEEWLFLANGFNSTPYGADPAFSGPLKEIQERCEAGSGPACGELAGRFARGEGVIKDDAAAVKWDLRGCELGFSSTCREAGAALEIGLAGTRDMPGAAKLFGKACELGDAVGCAWLGDLHAAGAGVVKDLEQAALLRKQACSMGHAKSCPNSTKPQSR